MDLTKLTEPFPLEDIEWRVSRSGKGQKGIFCLVIAYITARAIQKRLDDVVGVENWRNEEPRILEINGKSYFSVGISIRLDKEWVTKWDVCEPTRTGDIDPAKGGFSGGMKRAGAQWGIGRYLYYLDEVFAETTDKPATDSRQWTYAKLSEKHGSDIYYWKSPDLPAWALPKEPEHKISEADLNGLKKTWRDKFAPEVKNPKDLRNGFALFVIGVVGEFPSADFNCWTRDVLDRCQQRITETTDPAGPASDVPFE